MSRAIWAESAQADLAAIDDFYRDIAPHYAERVGRKAVAAGRFLTETPRAGVAIGDLDLRKWRVVGTRHLLIYRVVAAGIEILHVRHAAEDWRPA